MDRLIQRLRAWIAVFGKASLRDFRPAHDLAAREQARMLLFAALVGLAVGMPPMASASCSDDPVRLLRRDIRVPDRRSAEPALVAGPGRASGGRHSSGAFPEVHHAGRPGLRVSLTSSRPACITTGACRSGRVWVQHSPACFQSDPARPLAGKARWCTWADRWPVC